MQSLLAAVPGSRLGPAVLATQGGGGGASGGGEGTSGLELVLPDVAEMVWGTVGFAILMAVMFWKVFPALNAMLEERRSKIQGRLEEAESVRAEAERLRSEYRRRLDDARGEADAIIAEAREEGERQRSQIVERAQQEAEQIKERATGDMEAERNRVVQSLRGQFATLSVELAGKIVERELDTDRHRELVDSYIEQLSGMNGRRGGG